MNKITHKDKIRQTIVAKYGSWEAYKEYRYGTPKAKADLAKAQSAGGKASLNRPFKDREFASKMGKKARQK